MLEDALRSVRKYYYNSPSFIQKSIGSAYRMLPLKYRLGSDYIIYKKLLETSENWSSQQICDYQFEQIKLTLSTAERWIPYYQKSFAEYGVKANDFKALEDIVKFPVMDKQDVKDNYEDLVNPNIPKWKHLITTTGGSTAAPMKFLHVKGLTRSKEKAFIYQGWSRVGYKPGAKAIQLKGRSVGNPEKGVFWEFEAIQNILEMDSNYLTTDYLPAYIAAMRDFRAEYIIAFPSSIYQVAKYIRDEKIDFPPIKAIMLASENVYPWQRETIEEVFQCRTFSHYGHSEMILLGMEAPDSHDLLFFPEYGYLEVLDESLFPITKTGEKGQIIGTSFNNELMPFIRYKTQDYCELGQQHSTFNYPTIKDVEGRLQEFIVTKDNRHISICTMGAAHFDVLDHVHETQYYQDKPGHVTFRVVPKKGYCDKDKSKILNALNEKLKYSADVCVEEVKSIERTRSGKHMMIIQKIPIQVLEGTQDLVLKENL